jgi:heme exporter protein D
MGPIGEFFAMGGYGGFVWSAYAIAVVVIGGLVVVSRRTLKARESEVAALEAARPPRRARHRTGADDDS